MSHSGRLGGRRALVTGGGSGLGREICRVLTGMRDPANVADAALFADCQPPGTVVPESTVLPAGETSWP